MIDSATGDPGRRLDPRIIDSDWLVLKGMRRAIESLAQRLSRPGMVALDFGCGTKPYARLFTDRGCRYLGADFDGAPDFPIAPDGRISAPDQCADLVVSFQVLEHVRDLDTYFAEAQRVLRPGGAMVLSTHGTWLYHPHPEDHRRWTREGLVNDIETRGFDVVECTPVVGPLGWTTLLRLTCWCFALKKIPGLGPVLAAGLSAVMNLRAVVEEAVTPAWVTKDNACVYVTLCRPRPA